jgi:hypothetical protein
MLALALLSALAFSTGCRWCDRLCGHDPCATIPKGAIPQPNGTYACQWQNAQIDRAQAGKFVIQKYEWYKGGETLGPDGKRHVATIAKQLPHVPYPVVVATSDDEDVDNTRREFIVQRLSEAGVEDAEERVVLAVPEGEGLYGLEAQRFGTARQMGIMGFGNSMGGGGMMGGGGFGGAGGFGGGGFGGMGGGMMGGMGGGMGMF